MALDVPRIRKCDVTAEWRSTPVTLVTFTRQVVFVPVVVVTTFGVTRTLASLGKTLSTPSIVHVLPRAYSTSGRVELALKSASTSTRIFVVAEIDPRVVER